MKTLRRMQADGLVTSRKAGRLTLWRIAEKPDEKNSSR